MAIEHELSSEIAAALLAGKERAPSELDHLKETVFRVHSTLQQLTTESRRKWRVFRASENGQRVTPPKRTLPK
jgi:hypothetical protein